MPTVKDSNVARAKIKSGEPTRISRSVIRCPECGGTITATVRVWAVDAVATGDGLESLGYEPSEVDVECVNELRVRHMWRQSDWQEVVDKVKEFCGVRQ